MNFFPRTTNKTKNNKSTPSPGDMVEITMLVDIKKTRTGVMLWKNNSLTGGYYTFLLDDCTTCLAYETKGTGFMQSMGFEDFAWSGSASNP